ncbi:hypothetical protein [Streptococcus sp. X13SY08]|uniref:hypothetical protein n=1 Tax=Streptococcus sp. X13SY08 TaxID=1676616 RepID=UPI0010392672|nr:hypothetical protein [Streptococcus sp. X13SY08]
MNTKSYKGSLKLVVLASLFGLAYYLGKFFATRDFYWRLLLYLFVVQLLHYEGLKKEKNRMSQLLKNLKHQKCQIIMNGLGDNMVYEILEVDEDWLKIEKTIKGVKLVSVSSVLGGVDKWAIFLKIVSRNCEPEMELIRRKWQSWPVFHARPSA